MLRIELSPQPLTRKAFEPFGDVIETEGSERFEINGGTVIRYHDLARIETSAEYGRSVLSIFHAVQPAGMPMRIHLMERHPISTQAFIPLDSSIFCVVVAPGADRPEPLGLRAFITNGRQGVNLHIAVWHHPLIAFKRSEFLVVDRNGPGARFDQDYEEVHLNDCEVVLRA